MLALIIIGIQTIYILINLLLQYGLNRKIKTFWQQPAVSILIAARNEEEHLAQCLENIIRLDYPGQLLEVLILNDHSVDSTLQIAQAYAKQYRHLRVINIDSPIPGLQVQVQGKMNALAQGIVQATGEIILITDADCRVPRGWVSEFVKYFTADVGLAGSMTLLSPLTHQDTCFTRVQNLDWIFLQGVAAGTAALSLPVTVLGNNFGFRRQAYLDTGGFAALGFSLAEDMQLLQAIHRQGWKVVYPLQEPTAVSSEPLPTVKEFYRQRLRWVKSSSTTSCWGYLLMSTSLLAHLLMVVAAILGLLNLSVSIAIALVLLADFIFLLRLLKRFRLSKLICFFPLFEIFYLFYTLFFAVVFFLPAGVVWKDRHYK
jgi:cellulose synthase/poly-beta-1,6-N-acetylglucosamine synthase-like glycosyltransferase